jgi:ribosomal protein L39E
VALRVDFSKMAAVAMEMAKMLKKNEKHKNDHSRLLSKQKLMKDERNNIHI